MAKKKSFVSEIKGHMMTGISYMIPLTIGGALVMAIAQIIAMCMGITAIQDCEDSTGFVHVLYLIRTTGSYSLKLIPVVIAGFVAYSIADKPALVAGLIGGYAAQQNNAGFLGALVAGFLAGYVVRWAKNAIKVPEAYQSLMGTVVLPFFGTFSVVIVMGVLLAEPLAYINTSLTNWLEDLSNGGAGSILLAVVIGGMICFDLGGPVNKAADTAVNALAAAGVYTPKVMEVCAISIPPLAYFLATLIHRKRFSQELLDNAKGTCVMAIVGLTEGAIPYTLVSPLKLIPINVIGGILGTVIATALGAYGYMFPVAGIYGAFTVGNTIGYLIGMFVGALFIAIVAPLVVDFKNDDGEEITEDDIEISFE